MTVGLSVAALVVAAISAALAYASWRSAHRSAEAAEAADKRARTPRLAIGCTDPSPAPVDRVIYTIRNDGPQDLDLVVVWRPRPGDQIVYPIAKTDGPGGWAEDEVALGPLRMTQETRVTLCCGTAEKLPVFRVRVECRAGSDIWELPIDLPSPRPGIDLREYL